MIEMLDEKQSMLISLLLAGIRNKPFAAENDSNVDWQALIDEAGKHQVITLIYRPMAENAGRLQISDKLMNRLRENVLYEGMEQERNYIAFGSILADFASAGIPVIVLKGLVLRELYPDPALRTMHDFDVLVKPCDVDKAGALLVKSGYETGFDKGKHAVYFHPCLPTVEIHRSMAPAGLYENYTEFEDQAWGHSVPVIVSGAGVLSLDNLDRMIYQLIHMASHMIGNGFGLRQLCDFVLLAEDSEGKIDCKEFVSALNKLGLEKFARVLFAVCRRLFDLKSTCLFAGDVSDLPVESLIKDIFDGGIFGKSNNDRITANRMLYYSGGCNAKTLPEKLHIYLELLFPKAKKLDVRYAYAKKYNFLLPFAWIHRFFYCFIRRDIDFTEKLTIFTSASPSGIYSNRGLLLKKLGLID